MEIQARHRFNGSINARYYGALRIPVDEKKISAIAAVIYAAHRELVADSELLKSPSLERLAKQAPLTGSIIAKSIKKLSERETAVDALAIE